MSNSKHPAKPWLATGASEREPLTGGTVPHVDADPPTPSEPLRLMAEERREQIYRRQNGDRADLTPRQRRRLIIKRNQAARPTARTGRLRRRFDKKDQREVAARSLSMANLVRMLKGQK